MFKYNKITKNLQDFIIIIEIVILFYELLEFSLVSNKK